MKRSVPWLGLAAALFYTMPASAQESCSSWNTRGFFKESTVREVASCLAAGAEVMARTKDGWTPLHSAAGSNASPDVIAALVGHGAEVMARTEDGRTPLHNAAGSNASPDVIAALVGHGADVNAKSESGTTPWSLAQENEALSGTEAYWLMNEKRFK